MVRKINIESVYNDDIEDETEIKNEVEEAIIEEVKEVEIEKANLDKVSLSHVVRKKK